MVSLVYLNKANNITTKECLYIKTENHKYASNSPMTSKRPMAIKKRRDKILTYF